MFGKKSILWFVNQRNNILKTAEGSSFQGCKALPIVFYRKLIRPYTYLLARHLTLAIS